MSNNDPAAEVPYQSAAAPPSGAVVVAPLAPEGGGLLAMIERLATRPDLNIDVFERLLNARRQEEDRAAERAFNAAISAAKGELSPVIKTREVNFTGKSGTRTQYKYEQFADVARVVDPVFAKHGLSYRFDVDQTLEQVKVTCILSHSDGYSDKTKLEAKVDPGATGMSLVQALGSSLTYLQRYSLRAAIGLAASVDDDGLATGGSSPRITIDQANDLQRVIDETGRSATTLLRLVGVNEIADMNLDQFKRAKEVLDLARAEKRRKDAPGN
jgi:hypothetical protein